MSEHRLIKPEPQPEPGPGGAPEPAESTTAGRAATGEPTATTRPGASYLPAAGHDWLLPLYDPLTRVLGVRRAHRRLIDQAGIQPGHRVLEIGCGTGNLLLLLARRHPDSTAVGLDPDPKALARAERKARRAALAVRLDRGFAAALPYPDGSFDRVLSAFMFHHLEPDDRLTALREVRRVLAPGGSLHLIDFGGNGQHGHGHGHGLLVRRLHRHPRMRDNHGDRIPTLMTEAGLADPHQTGQHSTLAGPYTSFTAHRR